jgi:serine/threonine-protein kinase
LITDRFKILRKLTSDEKRKFSVVYECQDLTTSKKVTCKVIHKSRISTELELKRVNREGNFKLDCDGIPKLIDFIETTEAFIIVRDFIEGTSLENFTNHFWRKSKRKEFIKDFFEQGSKILTKLHSEGIYHCDLKLANFILSANGTIYLIDFGLIQYDGDILSGKTLFAMGYSPPEIILNHMELINHQTDYFSFGICLWELFVGELPLKHEHPAFMINLQITHPIPDHHRIPKRWKYIIQRLTAKHQFGKPPNQLSFELRNEQLEIGRNKRADETEFSALISS